MVFRDKVRQLFSEASNTRSTTLRTPKKHHSPPLPQYRLIHSIHPPLEYSRIHLTPMSSSPSIQPPFVVLELPTLCSLGRFFGTNQLDDLRCFVQTDT